MRNLLLLQGAPGAGKSTWVEKNGLTVNTINPDSIRLLLSSPISSINGGVSTSMRNDKEVWTMVDKILNTRMDQGCFTVLDATNLRSKDLHHYKELCKKHRYRLFVKQFKEPLEVLKARNKSREDYKVVPEEIIDKMYEAFTVLQIPAGIKIINSIDEIPEEIVYTNVDEYEKVIGCGDIHGVYDPLAAYLSNDHSSNNLYVFTGDYLDRGLDNVKVLKCMMKLSTKDNVILLEGNHERWLWFYATDRLDEINSHVFNNYTIKELDDSDITKKEIRQFVRRLAPLAALEFKGDKLFFCHGGIGNPNKEHLTTKELIQGVGRYSNHIDIAKTWDRCTESNHMLIHGHRNTERLQSISDETPRVFNLEGAVEHSGALRTVAFDSNSGISNVDYKSTYICQLDGGFTRKKPNPALPLLPRLRYNDSFIREKKFEHISSFNFSRKVFSKSLGDNLNMKTRGLFINNETGKIIGRGYDKFFNLNETNSTSLSKWGERATFPIQVYIKYNGYLGLMWYDEDTKTVKYCTKSMVKSDFCDRFKELASKHESALLNKLKSGFTAVFEVIDNEFDPHIIRAGADDKSVVLLDLIKNEEKFSKLPYGYLTNCGVKCKTKETVLENVEELNNFVEDGKNRLIEGFVLEDAAGEMIKLKTNFYNFWKHLRGVKSSMLAGKPVGYVGLTKDKIKVVKFFQSLPKEELSKSILDLRDAYLLSINKKIK